MSCHVCGGSGEPHMLNSPLPGADAPSSDLWTSDLLTSDLGWTLSTSEPFPPLPHATTALVSTARAGAAAGEHRGVLCKQADRPPPLS
jgi:hypothetical protein